MKTVLEEKDYVYITIPTEYVCIYHYILEIMSEYGIDMIMDCKASCKDRNNDIIDCYNMFNAAIAAKEKGNDKLADLLIKFVKTKLTNLYGNIKQEKTFLMNLDGGKVTIDCHCFKLDKEEEENPGDDNPGGDNPGGDNPGGDNPGGDNPGGDNPGGEDPDPDKPNTKENSIYFGVGNENNAAPQNYKDSQSSNTVTLSNGKYEKVVNDIQGKKYFYLFYPSKYIIKIEHAESPGEILYGESGVYNRFATVDTETYRDKGLNKLEMFRSFPAFNVPFKIILT